MGPEVFDSSFVSAVMVFLVGVCLTSSGFLTYRVLDHSSCFAFAPSIEVPPDMDVDPVVFFLPAPASAFCFPSFACAYYS